MTHTAIHTASSLAALVDRKLPGGRDDWNGEVFLASCVRALVRIRLHRVAMGSAGVTRGNDVWVLAWFVRRGCHALPGTRIAAEFA